MQVPNYIPEPLEVPGNITQAPYAARLRFIRKVALMHLGSILVVAALASAPLPHYPLRQSSILLLACLLALNIVRIVWRGTRSEPAISVALMPVLAITLAIFARGLEFAGIPPWPVAVASVCATLYAVLCGRDFSFVGQFLLSLIASSVVVAALCRSVELTPGKAEIALAVNAGYLFYLVYDSASLMARRRQGEELAAVVDLYRDVLNVFGWVVRCIHHWRKHKIWVAR